MKYVVLILFCIFGFQIDTAKVDTTDIKKQMVQKQIDSINNDIDSIKIILNVIKNKKH